MSKALRRSGFTLIELLIVVAIIGVLTALTLVVSRTVAEGSKSRATQDVIRSLEGALLAYSTDTGKIPLPYLEDPRGGSNPAYAGKFIPVADARNMDKPEAGALPPGPQMINSVGLLMAQIGTVASAKAQLEVIPQKFVRELDLYPSADVNSKPIPPLLTAFDAWGQPIRYVHPAFSGVLVKPGDARAGRATFSVSDPKDNVLGVPPISRTPGTVADWAVKSMRRSDAFDPLLAAEVLAQPSGSEKLPDADGGMCSNNTPYFYSAGPDKRVGTYEPTNPIYEAYKADFNKDNIYTKPPTFRGKRTSKS